jgi:hypothetical protein
MQDLNKLVREEHRGAIADGMHVPFVCRERAHYVLGGGSL